jgi:uncharacterized delta-60 repeat protein
MKMIFYLSDSRYDPNGNPDSTFDNDGKLTERMLVEGFTIYTSTAVQQDGKTIAAGMTWNGNNFDFVIARYNTDGTLDSTFNNNGSASIDFGFSSFRGDRATGVAIQQDGRIVAAASGALVRYNQNGILDSTFDHDGIKYVPFAISSIAVQGDGKIVAADSAIVRYNNDGSIDKTFSEDGIHNTGFVVSSVAIQTDAKIVVAGQTTYPYVWTLARFNSDGTPDNSFNEDGRVSTDFADSRINRALPRSVAMQNDGKIVVAGTAFIPNSEFTESDFALARYNTDGSLDSTFSADGKQTTDFGSDTEGRRYNAFATSTGIENDGKIVVAGGIDQSEASLGFALARYNADGSLDSAFSRDGNKSLTLVQVMQQVEEVILLTT